MTRNHYGIVLLALLLIFSFRVLAQLLQAIYPLNFLPAFEAWHSDSLPYSILLLIQIVIIILFGRVIWKLRCNGITPNYRWGKMWLTVGAIYFSFMLFRLLAGLTFAADHGWFGAVIPAFFHLDLASFLMVYGYFHYKHGLTSNAAAE